MKKETNFAEGDSTIVIVFWMIVFGVIILSVLVR
jgi:hypothetical protein